MTIRGFGSLKKKYKDVILTIGNFDGVHIGHQKIFKTVAEKAKALNGTAVAITFDPHPVRVVAPERGLRMLTTLEEKAKSIKHHGIEVVLCINFNRELANMEARDFVKDVIVDKLMAMEVIVGHDYTFGKAKKGTTAFLRRSGKKYGFRVRVIRNVRLLGDVVSSSRIRNLITRGKVSDVSLLLGRPYMIKGTVVKGADRGTRLLHIPTANITTPNELVPKEGVYAIKVAVGRRMLDGVANIGKNPTFGENLISYEVHILGFSGDILGKDIKLYFIERIRNEKTFPDIETLHDSIIKDIETAREILKKPFSYSS